MATTSTTTNLEDQVKALPQTLLILVGIVGSGKSTLSIALTTQIEGWVRVNQDELGDRRACEDKTRAALSSGLSVIVDRQNFDRSQRKVWIGIGREYGVSVRCLMLPATIPECRERLLVRTNHPTIPDPEVGLEVLEKIQSMWQNPQINEGFDVLFFPSSIPDVSLLTKEYLQDLLRQLDQSPINRASYEQQQRQRQPYSNWRGGGRGGWGGDQAMHSASVPSASRETPPNQAWQQ